jgi:hypothetical protein
MIPLTRHARQQFTRIGGAEDAHGPVAHALGQFRVERHQFVVKLGGVLVDGGKQRRVRRQARNACINVGLVQRDLGGVDRLGDRNTGLYRKRRLRPIGYPSSAATAEERVSF